MSCSLLFSVSSALFAFTKFFFILSTPRGSPFGLGRGPRFVCFLAVVLQFWNVAVAVSSHLGEPAYNIYTHFVPPEKYHEIVANARLKPVLDKASNIIVGTANLLLPERVANGFSKRPTVNFDTQQIQNTISNTTTKP